MLQLGRKRYWYTDIGAKKDGAEVVVSVRVSYARNMEDPSGEREEPATTVPKVVRYLLRGNKAYCGRPEFRLMEKPLVLDTVGQGKVLAEFIQSPERRYRPQVHELDPGGGRWRRHWVL